MAKFEILGPVVLNDGERRLPVGGPRQVALLVFLLVNANRAVSADQLIDALWGEQNAAGAVKRLQVAIARLRKAIHLGDSSDDSALRTVNGGYLLAVGPGELDADVFQARLEDGRRALEEGKATRAADVLRDALGLWRGPPFAEVAYEAFAQAEIRRLQELRLAALEARVEADLRLGRHRLLIGELEGLIAAQPTREQLAGKLMLALYRCGRQAEALEVYHRTRAQLAAELGLEPGPALRALQAKILEQSASLEPAADDVETALASRDASPEPSRLPARSARLFGRQADARALIDLLRRRDVRLVTVTGVGGVGKTTLAIEVAHCLAGDLADGAAFVDLAPLADPAGVADSVLHALGCRPEPAATANDTLCRLAAAREQLLVLDNLEHLLASAPLLATLLEAAPRLKLLVTSRAVLDLRAEHRYPLGPLAPPESREPAAVAAAPATALFIARAAARDPAFRLTADGAQAIATVCARVDGLPLAIELAAARTSTLAPQEIARRLDRILPTLGSGGRDAPDRQRTLRATLDWSYGLLDEPERAAFARLAVFAGGCTIDASHEVAGASLDVIDGLIAKSIVARRAAVDDETRLVMLEPVREYAAELLAAGSDNEAVGERHSRYYLGLARAASRELRGHGQLLWLRRLDAEADNLRLALARDRETGNVGRVLDLGTALEHWWYDRGLWAEGRGWIEDALAGAQDDSAAKLRADGLRVVAQLAAAQAEFAHSLAYGRRALELYRALDEPVGMSRCLVNIAFVHSFVGRVAPAKAAAAEAVRLARQTDAWTLAGGLYARAATTVDLVAAKRTADEAAALFERAGDLRALASLWHNLSSTALAAGELDEAQRLIERSLGLAEQIDDRIYSTYDLGNYALLALEIGDHVTAAQRFAQTLQRCQTYGLRRPVSQALAGVAAIAAIAGDHHRAARLTGASTALRLGQAIHPAEQRLRRRVLRPARRQLGEDDWKHAQAAGRHLTLEEAILLGLQTAIQAAAKPPTLAA